MRSRIAFAMSSDSSNTENDAESTPAEDDFGYQRATAKVREFPQTPGVYLTDLVILDLMLPEMDGWEVCRIIRQLSDVPIIMVTALNLDKNIIQGFNYGADDYVTKPFRANVLLARVQALLRRSTITPGAEELVPYDDDYLKIDIRKHQVSIQGKPVKLTAKEYQLLVHLFRNSAQVVTLKQILEKIWGREPTLEV